MVIGIDVSRAFSGQRTGIEEYSFQVIKNLANELKDSQVVLYVRSSGESANALAVSPLRLPSGWKIKEIKWPFLWTQVGLSLEMLFHPTDCLFVPSHVVPFIHPENTTVTVHGLEYEFFPEGYSFWERAYMRFSIKASCRWAKKIIAVSENTKKDLIKLYKVPEEKIEVVYEGVSENFEFRIPNFESNNNLENSKFVLFIGRLEARKNIIGIIKAFEILKEKHKIPHKLILAGKSGYGHRNIKHQIEISKYKNDIIETGFVSDEEKNGLLKNADVFLFPSFYEGFGLPILEAQSAGVPVVASGVSSMPEIAGEGALFVDPERSGQIAEAVYGLISDKSLRDDIIKKGLENVQRFSWSECGAKTAKILVE